MTRSPTRPGTVSHTSPVRGFRRERCLGCSLPVAVCLCEIFEPLSSRIEVCVVMPASESRSMSNTARVLARWLPGTRLIVRGLPPGEAAKAPSVSGSIETRHAALLFPLDPEPAELAGAEAAPIRVPSTNGLARPLPHGDIRQLVVADGTWSQARRIARRELTPLGLPRLALDHAWPSIYELRRRPSGLCTFEAIAIALGLLDAPELASALLERFSHWNRHQNQLKTGLEPYVEAQAPAPHPALARLREITASAPLGLTSD